MKRDWSRYAPVGLIIAGIAAFIAVCVYIIVPKWSIWLQLSLISMVVGLVAYVALVPGQVRQAIKGRQVRYGFNTLLMSLAFLGSLVVVNYLVFYNAKMNPKQTRWDLTEDKSNTLASETLDALSKLPDVVHAQAFYTPRTDSSTTQQLLGNYAKNSKGKFVYEFINPDQKLTLATQAGITADGQIVLTMGDRKELVSVVSEQELTSALVKLISNQKQNVYFLQDEGESDPNGTSNDSMSHVRDTMESKNYAVKTLKLAVEASIPQDANIIIIAGPKQPVSQTSVDRLAKFLDSGGSLIVMEGPDMLLSKGASLTDPLADYLSKSWGITLGNDVVITLEANQLTLEAKAGAYGNHVITQKMGAYTPIFPGARSVTTAASAPAGLTLTEIVLTTPNYANCFPACSWATTDIAGLLAAANGKGSVPSQSAADVQGPVPIAAVGENSTTKGRVVVFGSSGFASDEYQTLGNQDLLVNAIDWSAKQEQLINLTPKATKQRSFTSSVMKYSNVTSNLIFLGSVILLPGAVIFAGVVAWVIRRRRG